MVFTKRAVLTMVVIQTVLIVVLGVVAIHFRSEWIGAQAGTDYYRKALTELHDDHETALRRILLYQRENLQREYWVALDADVRHGILTKESAAQRIRLIKDHSR